jgi:hypothetical protein
LTLSARERPVDGRPDSPVVPPMKPAAFLLSAVDLP